MPVLSAKRVFSQGRYAAAARSFCFAFAFWALSLSAGEPEDFDAAAKAFNDSFYDRAARDLGQFIQTYPASVRAPEAALLRAQALLKTGQADEAVRWLTELAAPANLSGERLYWLGEAQLARGDHAAAAETFRQLLAGNLENGRKARAIYGQSVAELRLGNATNTIALLQGAESPFQKSIVGSADTDLVFRGQLLLSQALLKQTNHAAAAAVLNGMTNLTATPDLNWERYHALAELSLETKTPETALPMLTNLVALGARSSNPADRRMRTLELEARVYEALRRPQAAAAVHARLALDAALPVEKRRASLADGTRILVNAQQFDEAAAHVAAFLQANPGDPAADALRLELADLHLQRYYAAQKAGTNSVATLTNLLEQARAPVEVTLAQTNSSQHAAAQLKRGWVLWEQSELLKNPAVLRESLTAFTAAANSLAPSIESATAYHKTADALFHLQQFGPAITNYNKVVAMFESVPAVKLKLGADALYQMTRAHLQLKNIQAAGEISEQLLHLFPSSRPASQARLLYIQALLSNGQTSEARTIVTNLLARVPEGSALPEAQLALARTYVDQQQWTNALKEYDVWLTRNTNHTLRTEVEFERAWLHEQSGDTSKAYSLFTNFVSVHASHPLAPKAQNAVGDYHFNEQRWVPAEQSYKRVFQNTNWVDSPIRYQAQLMAARCAFFRQDYAEASGYLTRLYADPKCPPDLKPEALFILGDISLQKPPNPTNNVSNFSEAIQAFRLITQQHSTHPLAGLAWGKMGDCFYQYASLAPGDYALATNAYHHALNFKPPPPVRALCQAEVGLGDVLEKIAGSRKGKEQTALLQQALDHHLNVIYGKNLDGQPPDPFWLRRAATSAVRLAETLGHTRQAVELYQRLGELLPSLKPLYEKRIEALSPRSVAAQKN